MEWGQFLREIKRGRDRIPLYALFVVFLFILIERGKMIIILTKEKMDYPLKIFLNTR
jgi:hypothetical protein